MKRLFFLLVLVAAAVVAVGFYQGWFSVVTSTTPDGKQNINLTVDKDKIKSDEAKLKDGAKEVKDKAVEKVR